MQVRNTQQNTNFNLDALKNLDQKEIERVKNFYSKLTQKQKDLIKYQAPNAFKLINTPEHYQHKKVNNQKFSGCTDSIFKQNLPSIKNTVIYQDMPSRDFSTETTEAMTAMKAMVAMREKLVQREPGEQRKSPHEFTKNKTNSNTRFNLIALQALDKKEIEKVSELYPKLTQKQKDLIKHQAPNALFFIKNLMENTNKNISSSHFYSLAAQQKSSTQARSTIQDTFKSNTSATQKYDAYTFNDRLHEREIEAQKFIHSETMSTFKIVAVTLGVTAAIAATFLGMKKRE